MSEELTDAEVATVRKILRALPYIRAFSWAFIWLGALAMFSISLGRSRVFGLL